MYQGCEAGGSQDLIIHLIETELGLWYGMYLSPESGAIMYTFYPLLQLVFIHNNLISHLQQVSSKRAQNATDYRSILEKAACSFALHVLQCVRDEKKNVFPLFCETLLN